MNHEVENYSWGVIQDMIEKEINSAFKIRTPMNELPTKREIKKIIRQVVTDQRGRK
jgi:hypothetical protein